MSFKRLFQKSKTILMCVCVCVCSIKGTPFTRAWMPTNAIPVQTCTSGGGGRLNEYLPIYHPTTRPRLSTTWSLAPSAAATHHLYTVLQLYLITLRPAETCYVVLSFYDFEPSSPFVVNTFVYMENYHSAFWNHSRVFPFESFLDVSKLNWTLLSHYSLYLKLITICCQFFCWPSSL